MTNLEAPVARSTEDRRSPRHPTETHSSAERFVRKLLRVPEPGSVRPASAASAERLFGPSILLSAVRCLLTYIVLPIVAPLVGAASSVGPVVGLVLGVVAISFSVFTVRRFWLANHRYRWVTTWVYGFVGLFLVYLMVGDVRALIG